jgi:serpin B
MTNLLAIFLAILVFSPAMRPASSHPAVRASDRTPGQGPGQDADQVRLVEGNNAFAVGLYGHLSTEPGNLFFSPESISTAFAMAYAGAHGQTATEMQRVFHFDLPSDALHPAMGALLKGMNATNPNYELRVADALWAQQDASFLPSYTNLMQTDYGAAFHRVDFKTSANAIRNTINQWVEQQTDDKIQNLIGPGVLTPLTRLVLTNAIYFKGTWQNPFQASATQDEDFHLTATQTAKTPMMHRTGGYLYFDGGTFQELQMPYAGDTLAMVIFLPKETAGLAALEQQLTAGAVHDWIGKLEPARKVILTLPRFKMTQPLELSRTLAAMGMPQAFSSAADFSGMTGKPEFSISAAIHKAFIDVNEKGTEAAAATAVAMTAAAMRMPAQEPPPIVFRADHPFLFVIRDTGSGAILFMGRVEDPRK